MPTRKREASPPVQPPAGKPAPPGKSEPVARCGGYVDRGDGNGWVLEDGEN